MFGITVCDCIDCACVGPFVSVIAFAAAGDCCCWSLGHEFSSSFFFTFVPLAVK